MPLRYAQLLGHRRDVQQLRKFSHNTKWRARTPKRDSRIQEIPHTDASAMPDTVAVSCFCSQHARAVSGYAGHGGPGRGRVDSDVSSSRALAWIGDDIVSGEVHFERRRGLDDPAALNARLYQRSVPEVCTNASAASARFVHARPGRARWARFCAVPLRSTTVQPSSPLNARRLPRSTDSWRATPVRTPSFAGPQGPHATNLHTAIRPRPAQTLPVGRHSARIWSSGRRSPMGPFVRYKASTGWRISERG